MHALIRHIDIEMIRRAAGQRCGQRIALLAIERAHAADVGGEMAFAQEFRCDGLIKARRLPVDQVARADEGR